MSAILNKNNLHDYQRFAEAHIYNHRYCGLLLDMGLGKTVTTLTALETLLYAECDINKVLLVAPKRVVETVWHAEVSKWAHLRLLRVVNVIGSESERLAALAKRADIYVISRDNIAWLVDRYSTLNLNFDTLVLDELSSFKSSTSLRFKAVKHIRPYMKRVIGLTGTPAPNSLLDLWAPIYLLDRGARLEKTLTMYRNLYFRPAQTNGHIVYSYSILPGADEIIHGKIADICISMKALDHIQMPERVDNFIEVFLPPDIKKKYDNFEEEMVLSLTTPEDVDIPVLTAAALSNKLLQFANGAVYDEEQSVHEVHDVKIKALLELIEEAEGANLLVAWSYKHDRDRIIKALPKELRVRELKTAQDILDWNTGKIQVLLAHPASAGHGINLQAGGNIIVWFGLTWSLELYQQFNSRIFRQGQANNTVIIHHIVVKNTHDEDVIKAIQSKDKRQETLLASVKAKIQKYTLWH